MNFQPLKKAKDEKHIHYKRRAFWIFTHYTMEASYKKGQIFHVESYNVLLFGRLEIQNACLL